MHQDYEKLLEEPQWFYGEDPNWFNICNLETFTSKSCRHKLTNIQEFKTYHRRYLELIGQARAKKKISSRDYHRYFWEGLNDSLRNKIENCMLATNPDLDVTNPFHMSKIMKAAEYILSPFCFDQHLSNKPDPHSSDTESEEIIPTRHNSRRRIHGKPQYEDSDSSSTEEDHGEPVKTRERTTHFKSPPPQQSKPKKKQEDDVGKLISQMGQLNLADKASEFMPCPTGSQVQ